jgi:hypothetical protein
MAYLVNKTDGTAFTVLDGTKDTSSTSITLIGRLVPIYGESFNENFIHILENFAFNAPPVAPIVGQLWYDTNTNNLKAYNGSIWITVGSEIVGNVDLTGNLFIGPNNFKIQDAGSGNVTISNTVNSGNISFFGNVNGTHTRIISLNSSTGRAEVANHPLLTFDVATKGYVDDLFDTFVPYDDTALYANLNAIYANLAVRAENDNDLLARINAANAQILLRDTISRVDTINLAIDTALQANLWYKANINSPDFTGVPTAPTVSTTDVSNKIATTSFVKDREPYWDGSRRFISSNAPTSADGVNGDIWFKYS